MVPKQSYLQLYENKYLMKPCVLRIAYITNHINLYTSYILLYYMVRIGNKEKINITIAGYLKRQSDDLIDDKEFASMSELVSIALSEFFMTYKNSRSKKVHSSDVEEYDVIHR